MKRRILSAFAVVALLGLAGCGYKGNLYLPKPNTPTGTAAVQTAPAASQSAAASAVKVNP